MRFVLIRGEEWGCVWELGVDASTVDTNRYCSIKHRAVIGVVGVFEKEEVGL